MLDLTDWRIILTDLNSNPLAEISDEAIRPSHTEVLNGIDRMSFTLNLESQAAYVCQPISTLVKMWRDVPGQTPFPDGLPQYVGIITGRTRNAADRTATYTSHSPFWRLTLRYHIDAHDFTVSTGRGVFGLPFDSIPPHGGTDPTEIMWRMVDFTNQVVQYTQGDRTGIVIDAASADYFGANPAVLYDVRYPVGHNTWDLIQDIVMRAGFPDLSPTYIHVEGSTDLVYLNTVNYKGEDKSLSFDYRTGNKNLDDIVETSQMESGEYANYVVVQGAGDKSTGWYNPVTGQSGADQTIVRADGTSAASLELGLPDLISAHGLYMHYERDVFSGSGVHGNRIRYAFGKQLLRRLAKPPASYEIRPSMALTHAWPYTFRAGDTVTLNCDRDSMQLANVPVRITEVTLSRTDNKMEELSLTVVDPDSYKAYEFDFEAEA